MAAKKPTKPRKLQAPGPHEKIRARVGGKDTGPISLPPIPGAGETTTSEKVQRPETKVRPIALAYVPIDRSTFCECEYDLGEIGRAMDTEAMVFRSVIKHFTLATKEGWTLTGKDPETIAYIRRRLFEFELATLQPTEQLVREAIWNLILFSNSFLVYRRDAELSSGRVITKFEKELEPVAGVFCADPSSMRIRRNRWGEVKRYYQCIEGDRYTTFSEKYFEPEDVLHFHYAKKTGLAWGTPYIVPVLDDIRLLRNLEELTNHIAHKGAFPLYQYKVGTETNPAIDFEDGTSEVTVVEAQLRAKPVEGVWVTPERHTVEAVDATAPIRDLSAYLEYFKKRVLSGLNLSGVDVGEGDTANRGTATQMSKGLQYQCKDYQTIISYTFTQLFDDLLDEGGFTITPESRVYMSFPEIDVESQQLVNNHALALYQGNAIDEDEMRKAMGKEPFGEDQHEKRHIGRVQMPLLELQRQAEASIAAQKASASAKSTTSKNRPSNQSGTKGSAGSKANDFALHEFIVGAANQVVDEAIQIFADELPQDRTKLIQAMAEELTARLGDRLGTVPSIEGLLIAKSAPILWSATKDTANIFLDGLRAIYAGAIMDTLLVPSEEFVEEAVENPEDEVTKAEHKALLSCIDGLKDEIRLMGRTSIAPSAQPLSIHADNVTYQPPATPAPIVNVEVKVPQQAAPTVEVTVQPAPTPNIDVHVPAPIINVEPNINVDVAAPNVSVEAPNVSVSPIIQVPEPSPAANKKVSLANIKRDGNGRLVSAEAVTTSE